MFRSLLQAAFLASTLVSAITAIPTISVKGAKFFAGGQQFFIKGVAYQGTPSDPLVDTTQCQLDATLMQTIGTNSIRVYHVSPWQNHDGCMKAFLDAGIYVWLDLDTFNTTVTQMAPTWTEEQLAAFSDIMDLFHGYDNLAGFWIGNEVINSAAGAPAAPYVKAAVADMKSYMAVKGYRQIPIGYSAADIAELRPMLQNYLACGSDPSQSIDFFGLNSYEWCGDSNYNTSGYANLQAMAEGYAIPIFFSETGCNVPEPRTFGDQAAVFSPDMISTWSGSIIYEWVQETNNYGLVTYPGGQIYSGAPIPLHPDFDTLSRVWKNVQPSGVAEADYIPSLSAPACPGPSNGWGVNGDVPVPSLGQGVVNAVAARVKSTSAAPLSVPATKVAVTSSTLNAARSMSGSPLSISPSSTSRQEASSMSQNASPSEAAGSRVVVPALAGGVMWLMEWMV